MLCAQLQMQSTELVPYDDTRHARACPGHDETRISQTQLHDLAAPCARALQKSSAPKEGVGNAGCPLHPPSRVPFVVVERTRATTSTPESPGIPARNGFNGLCRSLPGDRALLPPSPADMFCLSPVGPTYTPRTCRQRRGGR